MPQRELPVGVGRAVVFVPSDDRDASAQITFLGKRADSTTAEVGRVHEGGTPTQVRNTLVLRHLLERPMS